MTVRHVKIYSGGMVEVKVLGIAKNRTRVQSTCGRPYWTNSRNIIQLTEQEYLEKKSAGLLK